MRWRRVATHVALLTSLLASAPGVARAEDPPKAESAPPSDRSEPMVIWPTLTPLGDAPGPRAAHRPEPAEQDVYARAQELDSTLRDAATDLGYALEVSEGETTFDRTRDFDLLQRAQRSGSRGTMDEGTWVVSARIERAGSGEYYVRVSAAPPRARTLRVRVERVAASDVSARGLVMLRDVLLVTKKVSELDRGARPAEASSMPDTTALRSPGRAVLAVSSAMFGAFTGYSLERASGSDDPRLLYPLIAIGTGAGLGSALLAAGEWQLTTGDAWVLAGGMGWGTASGLFMASGTHAQPFTDRYLWGVGGGLVGTTASVLLLTRRHATEGDATLTNSGGAIGTLSGVLVDLMAHGTLEARPYLGAGIGAGAGVVLGGLSTLAVHPSANRVLLVDLGIGIGGLVGSAAASPLLFEDVTTSKARGFLGATAAGMALGGVVAYALTRETAVAPTSAFVSPFTPTPELVKPCLECARPEGAYGLTFHGTL